jgi:hypothetical protein
MLRRVSWYDVSADGQRFVMIQNTGEVTGYEMTVVENWHTEFKDGQR